MNSQFGSGLLRLADPRISLASISSFVLGTTAAWADGPLRPGWSLVTLLGLLLLETAKNASGELVDFDSGADQAVPAEDRSPFSGGKRVLVDGALDRRQVIGIALVTYSLGIAVGLSIVLGREGAVLFIGAVGVALAYFYHAPPLSLSYRGLGELAVALVYGPLICCGTYLVQRNDITWAPVLVSLPLGILIGAFLWINEFPDRRSDEAVGKKTLVVRLGARRASRIFALLIALAYGILLVLPAFGLPREVWIGFGGLPHAIVAARRLHASPENTARLVPAQKWTLLSFLLLAAGTSLGVMVSAG
jgi:1,4-dihydroxy-2-naphthoate octaprenyltransferase